jgi:hypothetical protein
MASPAPPDYLAIQDLSANAGFLSRHRAQDRREPVVAWRPKTLQGQNSFEGRGKMPATATAVRENIRAQGLCGLDEATHSQINYPLRLSPAICMVWVARYSPAAVVDLDG